jgi:hypothetical protein
MSPIFTHINFLHAIDEDLCNLSRYIDFDERNYQAFSVETSRILLSACSEIDSILRQIVKILTPDKAAGNLGEYYEPILESFPDLGASSVNSFRFKVAFEPWANWKPGIAPDWWSAHNHVKHRRHECFHEGNLQNALMAVGALEITLMCFRSFHSVSGKGERQRVFYVSRPAGFVHSGQ